MITLGISKIVVLVKSSDIWILSKKAITVLQAAHSESNATYRARAIQMLDRIWD
jgi:hypothetical protein